MSASPVRRMTLQHDVTFARGLARHAVYPHRRRRSPLRHRPAAASPRPARLRPLLPGRHAAHRHLRRLCPAHLPVRRRAGPAPRPLGRDRPQGTAGQPPRAPTPGAPLQPGPACQLAPPARPPAAPGRRPDPTALPRPALPGRRRVVPRPGQERHDALPRLRHRLPDPARPARPGSGPTCCCWTAGFTRWASSATCKRPGGPS
jgi:hypothetical protein